VVGINRRNADFLLPYNPRDRFHLVDDKLCTKALAHEHGLPVPETYAVVRDPRQVSRIGALLEGRDSFVVKPVRGSRGKGVLVVAGRDGPHFVKPSGAKLALDALQQHLQNILAGLYSLGGKRDAALVEYRVRGAPAMREISFQGAPDIRVLLLLGYPVMAMMRAATRESDGRANLHQGAVGAGIDIATGRTVRAIHRGRPVGQHPDLEVPLVGRLLPGWDTVLDMAVTCQAMTGLGFIGVDLMIDEARGPLVIEVNARPGLSIQLANGDGLLHRLHLAAGRARMSPDEPARDRIAFARHAFAAQTPTP
jgi:alpha-L-glutamate ligase-like protein